MRNVDVSELKQFQSDIDRLVREMPGDIERVITESGEQLKTAVDQKTSQIQRSSKFHQSNKLQIESGHVIAAEVVNRARHAHLVEYGTSARKQKNGRYTGSMPELAPFRAAFDENEGRLTVKISTDVLNLIQTKLV